MEISSMQFIMERLTVINSEMGAIQIDVGILKSQMAQVVWLSKTIVGAVLILVISQAFQIWQIKKNGKR